MIVKFKATANVTADLRCEWIVSRTGTVNGKPAARLIGTDALGRER